MAQPLDKSNCCVSKSEKGNLYISHPQFKTLIRFYGSEEDLKSDPEWRDRVAIREGDSGGFYAVLAKTALSELEY